MSLRSILGGGRVTKKKAPRSTLSQRTLDLRQTKPGGKSAAKRKQPAEEDHIDELFDDTELDRQLDDNGLAAALADDLTLRDVVQALRYARGNMFEPVPVAGQAASGSGNTPFVGNSTRIAQLLDVRRRLPAMATTAHVAAILPNATATERETVALVRAGTLHKVVQPGSSGSSGGTAGEVLVETAWLAERAEADDGLSDTTKAAFAGWLRNGGGAEAGDRTTITIAARPTSLTRPMADELVHAGFLVGHGAHSSARVAISPRSHGSRHADDDMFARPEDRTTLLSLETVARAASGSAAAVGGIGAVYTAGGGGQRGMVERRGAVQTTGPTEDLLLAVPGHGAFAKLVAAALGHLVGLLARTPFREAPETTLRERWDASGGSSGSGSSYGHGRGFRRVTPSRTKKWKELHGLRFGWVLAEAVGGGLVEVFETGSVGRGVRLV